MSTPIQNPERLLVLYDGHCGLCNRAVRWFLRRDRWDRLRFAPSESPAAAQLLARHGFSAKDSHSAPDTILVVLNPDGNDETLLIRSDAVLALLAELPRPWPSVAAVLHQIPRLFRDPAYRLVAHWRYRIWGRIESCPLNTVDKDRAAGPIQTR